MNRPIKFRAWDKNKKVMLRKSEDGLGHRYSLEQSSGDDWWIFSEGLDVVSEEFELMQFIGLKDKNGREIYEEDIVRLALSGSENRGAFVDARVGYYPMSFCLYPVVEGAGELVDECERDFSESAGVSVDTGLMDWVEVVGNIYENPEMDTEPVW